VAVSFAGGYRALPTAEYILRLRPRVASTEGKSVLQTRACISQQALHEVCKGAAGLGLFGEAHTARILAQVILTGEVHGSPSSYLSGPHGDKIIDLVGFTAFVKEIVSAEDARACPHIKPLLDDGSRANIASGLDIWSNDTDPSLRQYYCKNFAALATTTYFVEAGVKMAAFADNKSRSEVRMSQYGIASNGIEEINKEVISKMKKSEKEYVQRRGQISGSREIKVRRNHPMDNRQAQQNRRTSEKWYQ